MSKYPETAQGGEICYSYDAVGHIISTTDQQGNTTTYDYDQAGNKIRETSYTYGLERISAQTGNTRTEYIYDGRGSVAAV